MGRNIEYQKTESKLKRLPMLKSRRILLENRLEEIKSHIKKYGKSYEDFRGDSVVPSKKYALMNMSDVDLLKADINKCDEVIHIFESAFEELEQVTYQIIDMKYIKLMSWEDVGYEVGYCIRSCNRIADAGLKTIEQMIGDVYEG